jgi:zinc-binding alcohol dehydrogenase family protein
MRAIVVTRYLPVDDPECFVEIELPTPEPHGHDLLVRVRAVSVNPVDTQMRTPRSEIVGAPLILGWDAAGVVEAIGEAVTLFRPGDEVYYAGNIDRAGSNSEYQLVDERIVGPKPRRLDFAQAAAMPLTTLTAWEDLFERLGIAPDPAANVNRVLLVIGGAGGVGSITIQLAKRLAGLRVVATASRPESVAWTRELGADLSIDPHQPFRAQLATAGLDTVNSIYCANATAQHLDQMADVIAPQGKICLVAGTRGERRSTSASFMTRA